MRISTSRARRGLVGSLLTASLALGGWVAVGDRASAQTNPFERGPAPSAASVLTNGTFAVSSATVASRSDFGGGTIYYPTSTSAGTFGAVAMSPGFTESNSYLAWLAQRVASHGFVVININTLNIFEFPDVRADELKAALDFVVSSASPVRDRVDPSRTAVAGHSMGGGGTIEAAAERPTLKAAVAFQPWHTTSAWTAVRVPVMIQGAQNDAIAAVGSHAEPFYVGMTAAPEKAYVEIAGASHSVSGANNNAATSRFTISWLKRFVDNDLRYDQFLCPRPAASDISEYRDTCPHGTTPPPTTSPTTTPTTSTPPTTTPPAPCPWWAWWCWFS